MDEEWRENDERRTDDRRFVADECENDDIDEEEKAETTTTEEEEEEEEARTMRCRPAAPTPPHLVAPTAADGPPIDAHAENNITTPAR